MELSRGGLGYYLPARQFLPGRLLINGTQILLSALVSSVAPHECATTARKRKALDARKRE
jgi:hypothetical protein